MTENTTELTTGQPAYYAHPRPIDCRPRRERMHEPPVTRFQGGVNIDLANLFTHADPVIEWAADGHLGLGCFGNHGLGSTVEGAINHVHLLLAC